MFTFAIILAIASTSFELLIAAKIPAWRRLSHKSLVFNLMNSMLLSYLTGIMFGAAGLIAMTAGVLSTLMTIPGYKILYWCYDSPEAQAHGGNLFQYYKQSMTASFTNMKTAIVDFFNMIYKILRIITFPIWATRSAVVKIRSIRS